jgi:dynein heavy chain, axonemal
VIQELNRW